MRVGVFCIRGGTQSLTIVRFEIRHNAALTQAYQLIVGLRGRCCEGACQLRE